MSGKTILIVGRRGSGKTFYTQTLVKEVHPKARLIHDVNQEYRDLYPHPFVTIDEFIEVAQKVKGGFILFEEATISIAYHGSIEEIRDLVVRARHTNNTVVFTFHSLRSVPRYLYDLSDYVILFKTNDNQKIVDEKFRDPNFTEVFLKAKESDWIDSGKRKPDGTPILYSPHFLYDIAGGIT